MLLALFLVLLQAVPTEGGRAEAERLFGLGRRLFAGGDAAGAVAAFQGAAATGWTAGALEYDWGTACLATGDLGCAVLHLERARRLMPDHAAIAHNLRIARERAGAEPPPASPARALRRGGGALLGLGLALYLGAITLAGYRLWTRRSDPWLRRALVVLAPMAVVVLGLGILTWAERRAPEAVVVRGTAVHDAPGSGSGADLASGHLVRVLGRRGDWVEVRLPDGGRGWLPARAVERI